MPLEEQLKIVKDEFYNENAVAKDVEEKKV
jgi:hypothetical protein